MIFPQEDSWRSWGITHDLHKFFLLRWQEMFAEDTFDSWQVRFTNTIYILNEIIEAINVVEDIPASHRNIAMLIDEAIHHARSDIIISESFPYVIGYLEKIKISYEEKVKNKEKRDLKSFRRLVMVTLGNLTKYKEKLFSRLHGLISNPPEPYKNILDGLIMSFGIELKSMGYSIPSLRDAFQIFAAGDQGDFPSRFKKFLTLYDGSEKKYECRFLISWPGDNPLCL